MGSAKSLYIALLTVAVAGLMGCSEAKFSSSQGLSKSGNSPGGLGDGPGVSDDSPPTLDDILGDGEIDDEDERELDEHDCSKNRKEKKILICHFPPGNPDNAHTICIGLPALEAHIDRHGDAGEFDHLGPCENTHEEDHEEDTDHDRDCKDREGSDDGDIAGPGTP